MKYFTLAPDYTGPCIVDDFNGPIELSELQLPSDFILELNIWHQNYKKIIPLSEQERKKYLNEINLLDVQGLKLAEKLKNLIPGGARVRYFSEGKLRYLNEK